MAGLATMPIRILLGKMQIAELRHGIYPMPVVLLTAVVPEAVMMFTYAAAALLPAFAISQLPWSSFAVSWILGALLFFVFEVLTDVCAFAGDATIASGSWLFM